MAGIYLRSVQFKDRSAALTSEFPYNLPSIRAMAMLSFKQGVTILAGENGSGKSTILEAIAISLGLNPEGGTRNFHFETASTHSELWRNLRTVREPVTPADSFFFRSESYYNVATEIDRLDSEPGGRPVKDSYGGKSLHAQSHGESFVALMLNKFRGRGLYILDEPEAALSPSRQLAFLARIHQLVDEDSQFIIATHSPIIMGYPGARIFLFSERGIEDIEYEQTEYYTLTKQFLGDRKKVLDRLFGQGGDED